MTVTSSRPEHSVSMWTEPDDYIAELFVPEWSYSDYDDFQHATMEASTDYLTAVETLRAYIDKPDRNDYRTAGYFQYGITRYTIISNTVEEHYQNFTADGLRYTEWELITDDNRDT